jgi:hypothetical protein
VVTSTLSTRIDEWIYGRLAAATVPATNGRRYIDDSAPATVTYPYAQFSMLSGQQMPVLNGTRLWGEYVYIVQAIAQSGTWASVEAASDQIYAALHQQTGTADGVEIQYCACEEEIRRAEAEEGGTRYRYLGWRVRLVAVSP